MLVKLIWLVILSSSTPPPPRSAHSPGSKCSGSEDASGWKATPQGPRLILRLWRSATPPARPCSARRQCARQASSQSVWNPPKVRRGISRGGRTALSAESAARSTPPSSPSALISPLRRFRPASARALSGGVRLLIGEGVLL